MKQNGRTTEPHVNTHGSIGDHPLKFYNNTIIGGGRAVLQTRLIKRARQLGKLPGAALCSE
jgi:hypothetical protein